jgi:hypothetical protein
MTKPTTDYRTIPLTKGQVALVDASDYEALAQFKWRAWWNKNTRSFYAIRHASTRGGCKPCTVYMHRQILGLEKGDKLQGEHRFHETLDNRRTINGEPNLRVATNRENHRNMRIRIRKGCPFKGVYFSKNRQKFYAQIRDESGVRYLGGRESAEAAAKLYDAAALRLFGEFANVNFKGETNAA